MPQLAMHQLRVAAVAQQICAHIKESVNADLVIAACLLHDMGNILKFDLSQFPEFLQPEGAEYWQKVKDDYAQKYQTTDDHAATLAIVQEIGAPKRVGELVGIVGFVYGSANAETSDYDRKICAYADMRVGPHGILSLEERLMESAKRYSNQNFKPGERNDPFAVALYHQAFQVMFVSQPGICKGQIHPAVISSVSV